MHMSAPTKARGASRILPVMRLAGMFLAGAGAALSATAAHDARAQASAITGNQIATGTVETVDPATGTVLLRDQAGSLVTVHIPRGARHLPRVQPGDKIRIRFFQTIAADIAAPGSPMPESTVSSAQGLANRHPHGTMISFRRERVRILAIDAPHHIVTVIDPAQMTRTVTVREKPMQDLLATLKVGDQVDITTMDAVSFTVTNRVVTPSATVTEHAGRPAGGTPPGP